MVREAAVIVGGGWALRGRCEDPHQGLSGEKGTVVVLITLSADEVLLQIKQQLQLLNVHQVLAVDANENRQGHVGPL